MPAYTFNGLSDADFEDLARDLLQAHLDIHLESFKAGKDQGVDLQHASQRGKLILQCKHYWRSGLAALRRSLRHEKSNLQLLAPRRYIVCTSVALSLANKRDLVRLLHPHCRRTADIIGLSELNGLLRDHPRIEESHHKLWLTSVPVLQRILRNGAAVWTDLQRQQIERKLSLYVQTPAFDQAMRILREHNYCIISGIPGIGKTTLAQVLATWFLDRGYELVVARENVQEALDGFHSERKQIIYYDDFLGRSNIRERLGKNEDEGILRLLRAAADSTTTKVLLTTREYILEQAKEDFERLNSEELEIAKCILELDSYTRGNKARILYNHLFFSNLGTGHIGSLLQGRSYRSIIDHDNYSPRLIEWMTIGLGAKAVHDRQYAQVFLSNLDYPERIWKHAFENQISEDSRCLLHVLAILPEDVVLEDLRQAWKAYLPRGRAQALPGEIDLEFIRTVRQLDSSFIRTQRIRSETAVAFHNASIRDFVIRRLGNDRRLAKELLRHVCFFEQIAILMQLQTKGELDYSADGIINDGAELRDAIRGCLTTRSPVVYQYQRMSLGGRLSAIGKWAVAKERKSLTEFACRLLRRMMAAGAGEELTVEVTGFLEALLTFQGQSAKHQKLIRQIIITIGGSMDERAEVESVETWGRFLKTWRRELRGVDVTTMKSRVVGFFEAEAESILKTNDTAEDVRFWARDLKQVADIWGVNIRPITKNLRNAAREYPRRKKTKLDQYKRDRSSATGADADNAIDRLFSSLARRESEPQIQANR